MEIKQLRSQRPRAWSAILAQEPEMAGITVTRVTREKVSPRLTRFTLDLAGHQDPITLIGKETDATEARFYQEIAPRLPFLTPRCWFSYVDGPQSWVVLDEVMVARPPARWLPGDAAAVMQGLAALHVEFWDREDLLDQVAWLENPLEGLALDERYLVRRRVLEQRAYYAALDVAVALSDHAIWSSGRLAPYFLHAAAAVAFLRQRGGWPGVLTLSDLDAAADLLDDPVPLLYSLRDQPLTLQHGAPFNHHWQVTPFNNACLLDWQQISAGPGVVDLVHLVEQFNWLLTDGGAMLPRSMPIASEETLIDSYILHLAAELGPLCDTRTLRQSIPAGRCFHLLAYWLPRLTDWLVEARRQGHTLSVMSDEQLQAAGLAPWVALKPQLAATINRFVAAAKML
ncbi:MAG: hypothetical protein KJ063_00835 [Anaerolineae bacterium]|nr:hypothetical protein [Anaerolineae bacterium]